ncbi:MAG TPA: S-layer homology domain-containing protein [Acidimicrobiales bacterium]|nr:S-layer homology domain-containing protein [Acidimicrobiales bacterium]
MGADNVHSKAIDCLRHRGLTRGAADNLYQPGGTVDRGQMAAFIARLLRASDIEVPANPTDAFVDDEGSVHEADININALATLGVVRGTGENVYHPDREVTRGQMATLLMGAGEHALDLALTIKPARLGAGGRAIEDCRVKSVSHTHSLIVELSLKDGGTHTTTEPHSDAVFDEIAEASHCPPLESISIE